MDFFKLKGFEGLVSSKSVVAQRIVSNNTEEKVIIANMKQDIDIIEQELEKEESCVAFYIDSENISSDDKSDDSSCLSYNSDDLSSTETKKNAKYNGIIHLYLNGEIFAYKAKTLRGDVTSKLARDLSDNIWVEEHTIVTENGKTCILME